MEENVEIEEPDLKVSVNKSGERLSVMVETTDGAELSHSQSLSGLLSGFQEMCNQLQVNYLEFFLDEFGIDHNIDYGENKNPQ